MVCRRLLLGNVLLQNIGNKHLNGLPTIRRRLFKPHVKIRGRMHRNGNATLLLVLFGTVKYCVSKLHPRVQHFEGDGYILRRLGGRLLCHLVGILVVRGGCTDVYREGGRDGQSAMDAGLFLDIHAHNECVFIIHKVRFCWFYKTLSML